MKKLKKFSYFYGDNRNKLIYCLKKSSLNNLTRIHDTLNYVIQKNFSRRIHPNKATNEINMKINIEKKDADRKIDETFENKTKSNDKDEDEDEDVAENHISDNLYLKILSSLSKVENIDQEDALKRIEDYKKKLKIEKINDSDIVSIIKSVEEKANEKNFKKISNLIEEELSEEEFADKQGIRFRRPPHTLEELRQSFEEAEKIYEKNKNIFLGQNTQDLELIEKKFYKNIPKYMRFEVLSYPPNKSDIVLIGVNRFSNIHALWLSEFLDKYEPDGIGIEFHPDDPIFIEGNDCHFKEWKKFIMENIDYKFKVNPLPQNVNDVILTPNKIESLIQNNIDKNPRMKLTSKLIFTDNNLLNIQQNIAADAQLTPLLYSYYTRLNKFCPVFICDYPKLNLIKTASLNISNKEMKSIFKSYLDSVENNNFIFDYKLMNYEIFLKDKISYMAELTRQMTFSSKKIVMLIDQNYHEHFIETWRKLEKNIQPLIKFHEEKHKKNINFVDFIENLIMIDLLEDSFVFDHFVDHKNFPFPCLDDQTWRVGYNSIFDVWGHYSTHYKNLIQNLTYSIEKLNDHYNQFNFGELDRETSKFYKNSFINELRNNIIFDK